MRAEADASRVPCVSTFFFSWEEQFLNTPDNADVVVCWLLHLTVIFVCCRFLVVFVVGWLFVVACWLFVVAFNCYFCFVKKRFNCMTKLCNYNEV